MSAAHRSSGEDFPQSILMAPSPRLNGSFSFSFEERRPAPFMYAYNLDDDERTYVRFPPPRRDPTLVDRPQSSRSTSGWHRQDRTPTTTATATADPTMTAEEFEALPAAVRRKVRSSTRRSFDSSIKTDTQNHIPILLLCYFLCYSSPKVRTFTAYSDLLVHIFILPHCCPLHYLWRSGWRQQPPIRLLQGP